MVTETDRDEAESTSNQIRAVVFGFGGFAVLNAVCFVLWAPSSYCGLSAARRLVLHLYELGQSLLLGGIIALGLFGLSLWRNAPRYSAWGLAALGGAVLGLWFLREDLERVASRMGGGQESELPLIVLSLLSGWGVVLGAFAVRLVARGYLRAAGLVAGAFVTIANYLVLPGDYPGAHLLLGATAAVVFSSCLVGVRFGVPRRVERAVMIGAGALALLAAFVPPGNAVRVALTQAWSRSLAEHLPRAALLRSRSAKAGSDGVYCPDTDAPPIPPSEPLIEAPIIIYYSVDALRADRLTGKYAKQLPHLAKLRDDSYWFSRTWAPGANTSVTLTSVMTGAYFSQLYWTKRRVPVGRGVRALFAHEDTTPHFPELLSRERIPTVQYAQAKWLQNEYGVTRGFSTSRYLKVSKRRPSTRGKWTAGGAVVRKILERLKRHKEGPLFVFFHDLDAHAPYDLGRLKKGSAQRRQMSELELVDDRIRRLRRALRRYGLAERTILIVSSDHGEAFGEHGTRRHGQNLYEEQVRVPLIINVPGHEPRRIDDPVTLMDLGPTILDLMGLPTPRRFMGQSLVPYFHGEKPDFERPIAAEGRLKQMMVLDGKLKLIRDVRDQTYEIYDLGEDPEELHNLYDEMDAEGDVLMARLEAFFELHTLRKEGYEVPYKR